MLDYIKKTLWTAADKLRANAAEYKYIVLGLIFLKYISDSFAGRRAELQRRHTDTLLPRLISGQLRLLELEKEIAEVGA